MGSYVSYICIIIHNKSYEAFPRILRGSIVHHEARRRKALLMLLKPPQGLAPDILSISCYYTNTQRQLHSLGDPHDAVTHIRCLLPCPPPLCRSIAIIPIRLRIPIPNLDIPWVWEYNFLFLGTISVALILGRDVCNEHGW